MISGDACQLPFEAFFTNFQADGSIGAVWTWGFCGDLEAQCAYVTGNVAPSSEAHSFASQFTLTFGSASCPSSVAMTFTLDDSGTVMQANGRFQSGTTTVVVDGAGTVQVLGTF